VGELLLGIDVGTYSSKGVLCRSDGTLLAEARAEHEMSVPRPGWAEHDLPYLRGDRTPIHAPDARGVLAGLTLGHRRGHAGRSQIVPRQTIGAAYGDACLAGLASGLIADRSELATRWVQPGTSMRSRRAVRARAHCNAGRCDL